MSRESRRGVALLALLCWGCSIAGCMNLPRELEQVLECPEAGAADHFSGLQPCGSAAPPRWQGLALADGQIIVNEHPGARSLLLSLAAARFSPYIHAGIIALEDEPQVYEAFGHFVPLPWGSKLYVGAGVRRVSLESFLARGGIVAIHEPAASVDRSRLLGFAREAHRKRVRFDGRYDPLDASRYYCIEFVARALTAAGGEPVPMVPVSRNASMQRVLEWMGVRATELQLAGDVVAGMRREALVSRTWSPAKVDRYFSLKRELHRRFTEDQRLGALFVWSGRELRLRPSVQRFLDEAMRSDESPRALADRLLGPIGAGALAAVAASQ